MAYAAWTTQAATLSTGPAAQPTTTRSAAANGVTAAERAILVVMARTFVASTTVYTETAPWHQLPRLPDLRQFPSGTTETRLTGFVVLQMRTRSVTLLGDSAVRVQGNVGMVRNSVVRDVSLRMVIAAHQLSLSRRHQSPVIPVLVSDDQHLFPP